MGKEKTVYVCSNCGQDAAKWVGRCPVCGQWNTYKEMTGKDGRVVAVHGGTEAGVFRGMIPEIDIVGIGPASGGAHTPEEWVDLCSYERAFNLLVKILDKLCDEQ